MINKKIGAGYILITTLILLLMLTILGVSQISINSSQTRVATNVTDSETSFEKTEGAGNEAINRILANSFNTNNFINNTNGLYLFNQNETPIWQTVNWNNNTAVISSFSGLNGTQASYVIEQLPSVAQTGQNIRTLTKIYRVTGHATGQTGAFSVLIQNTIQQ